jgi:hypothetical protein
VVIVLEAKIFNLLEAREIGVVVRKMVPYKFMWVPDTTIVVIYEPR